MERENIKNEVEQHSAKKVMKHQTPDRCWTIVRTTPRRLTNGANVSKLCNLFIARPPAPNFNVVRSVGMVVRASVLRMPARSGSQIRQH